MKIDLTAAPTTKRIAGTLHRRGYLPPAPLGDGNPSREKPGECGSASRPENNKPKDQREHAE